MSKEIILVENLSKIYKLGEFNTSSLSHDLNRWFHRMSGKKESYEQFAEENDRTQKSSKGYVWSLRNIDFSVNQGEVLGIIGRNGAGKSTLLKLLSKITKPTSGCIKIDGRVASLLEVGTGFHPDLSGRENIFLNGAILGMKKQEIKRKFEEIVDFSGIEKYLETPVKRYSSGMYVRLAFAVAAHLEPEILIIDEVLAVGDTEFQQKCLGKLQDVANEKGRTILFVSHNNTAIKRLCTKVMLLEKGMVKDIGPTEKILELYQITRGDIEKGKRNNFPENIPGHFLDWKLEDHKLGDHFSCYSKERIIISAGFIAFRKINRCVFHVVIRDGEDNVILHASSIDYDGIEFELEKGNFKLKMECSLPIRQAKYHVELGLVSADKLIDEWKTTTKLSVLDSFDHHSSLGLLNIKTRFSFHETHASISTAAEKNPQ